MRQRGHWTAAKIGEYCLVGDGTHAKIPRQESGVMYLTSKNFKAEGLDLSKIDYISTHDFERHFRKGSKAVTMPELYDVLVSIIGSLGEPYVVRPSDRFGLSSSVAIIRPRQDMLAPEYLYYWMKGSVFQSAVYGTKGGVAQSYLSLEMIRSLPLQFPTLNVQRNIVDILSAYDDLIENNTRRIRVLEEMSQVIYREWFVNFRFPGHAEVNLVESGVGPIPEEWSVVSLETLYGTGSGGTPSRKINEYFGGSIPWVKTKELNDGFIFDTEETITDSGLKCSSARLFPPNTVLMAMYGATIGKLGILTRPATCNQACCAMTKLTEPFGPEYLFLTLQQRRNDIIGLRMGAAQQNISQEVIKNLRILRPIDGFLTSFNRCVEPIFDELRVLTQKNINLRQTRDLLLPKLISGEVSVKEFEPEAVAQAV